MKFEVVDDKSYYGLALSRLNNNVAGLKTRINSDDKLKDIQLKIGGTTDKYFSEKLYTEIGDRKNPGVTYVTYSNYDKNYLGSYDYLIGEETRDTDTKLPTVTIPKSNFYLKITTSEGEIPEILQETWSYIWKAEASGDLSSKICELRKGDKAHAQRKYDVDFEIYDHRASDPSKSIIDVYIGFEYTDSLE